MSSIKLCALVVAAAFAAPVFAQKAIGSGDMLLSAPKPPVIPKLDLPAPPVVQPAKPVGALSTTGLLPAIDSKGLGGAAIAPLNLRPETAAPPESGRVKGADFTAPPGSDERGGVGGGAFAGARAKALGPEGGELLPAVDKRDLSGASVSDLKPNIDLKGLTAQRPGGGAPPEGGGGANDPKIAPPGSGEGGGGAFAGTKAKMMGLEGEKGGDLSNSLMMGEGRSVGSGANEAIKNAVGNTGPIDGAKYGDTFGGDRVNRKSQGSLNSFAGGGKGRASDGSGAEAGSAAGGAVVPAGGVAAGAASGMAGVGVGTGQEDGATVGGMLNGEGGRSSGNAEKGTVELLGRGQLQGADGYAPTKGMTQTQRNAYWAQQSGKQKKGYERDDSMGTSGGPMGRGEFIANQRGIAGRTGGAGGSNDGRGEQGSSTSATGGGIAVITNKADGPERVEGPGTLNMDAALKINTLVNPGAR